MGPRRRALLTGCALVLAGCGGTSSALPAASPAPRITDHLADLAADGSEHATLDVTSGANTVIITTADLGGRLVAATTPPTSGQRPTLTRVAAGVVDLQLGSSGTAGGPSVVTAVVDRSVPWTIELDGGATVERVDLRGGRADLVDLGAGVSRATILLAARSGTQRVEEAGGATHLSITAPREVATRVAVLGGASTVVINAKSATGIGAGRVFQRPGYPTAPDRLDVELHGGVSDFGLRSLA